ncbi:MAG: adenylate cyclase [Methanobacteriota archaeon]|nr:MAG: adenylate cyclase [Euryarchaeota archaeon]
MGVNVEIKAKCQNHDYVRSALEREKAVFVGVDNQVDTYFNTSRGRLKLREGMIEKALIYYERPDKPGPKRSSVWLYQVSNPKPLRNLLEKALGVRVVVRKRREIYRVGNVKIHLDEVPGLGWFLEVEAADEGGLIGERRLRAQCEHYLKLFGVRMEDLVATSYGDMLLETKSNNSGKCNHQAV